MWDLIWSIFSAPVSSLMLVGAVIALYQFGGPISTALGNVSGPISEWVGKAAPGVFQSLWEGIQGLASITLKTALVLALLGFGLYLGGRAKCDCQPKVESAIKDLREDYQFVPRKKAKKLSAGGFFNVF